MWNDETEAWPVPLNDVPKTTLVLSSLPTVIRCRVMALSSLIDLTMYGLVTNPTPTRPDHEPRIKVGEVVVC